MVSSRRFLLVLLCAGGVEAAPLRLLALGDMGVGNAAQYTVAAAMRQVCIEQGCDAALGLGDNIYAAGVWQADSPEFQRKFEQPYAGLDLPFYMTLGNHDQTFLVPGDGGAPWRGDLQVAYGQRQDKASTRWRMPGRYYKVSFAAEDGSALLDAFAFDSGPLAPYSPSQDARYRHDGPFVAEQSAWLQQQLAASQARWRFAFGHHPYRNNGSHGNAGNFDGMGLKPVPGGRFYQSMLQQTVCDRVDLLLSGHDHSLQLLPPVADCGRTAFLISGAAAKTYVADWTRPRVEYDAEGHATPYQPTPSWWQAFGELGFFRLEVSTDALQIDAYTVDHETGQAKLAHRQRIVKP